MDRKKIILFALGAIFFISLYYRVLHPFKQERVADLTYMGNRAHVVSLKHPSASPSAETKVMLDLFLNPPRNKGKVIKNIFQATKTRKSRKQAETVQRIEQKEAKETVSAISEKEAYEASVKRGLASLIAFGMYESRDEKIIFLERGKEVLLVRKGDRIDGKYLVEKITDQRVILKAEQINEPVYIDISGL
jgi:hypothetical protein